MKYRKYEKGKKHARIRNGDNEYYNQCWGL